MRYSCPPSLSPLTSFPLSLLLLIRLLIFLLTALQYLLSSPSHSLFVVDLMSHAWLPSRSLSPHLSLLISSPDTKPQGPRIDKCLTNTRPFVFHSTPLVLFRICCSSRDNILSSSGAKIWFFSSANYNFSSLLLSRRLLCASNLFPPFLLPSCPPSLSPSPPPLCLTCAACNLPRTLSPPVSALSTVPRGVAGCSSVHSASFRREEVTCSSSDRYRPP